MSISKKSSFYQDSEDLAMGRGMGHCDLEGNQTICDGDIKFCENPDALSKQLSEQESKEDWNNKGEKDQKKPSNYRVLVVDDEEPMRELMVTLLSRQGHQCITARNGNEALNKISQHKFDAVITDIVMPEMDGIVLTKEILILYPDLPIMVMTGYSGEYSAESAIAAGARDFINKPFSIDEFTIRFHKMMHDHEMLCRLEAKKNELIFSIHREFTEKIEGLQREMGKVGGRLTSKYGSF